jgi:hypothetical protein
LRFARHPLRERSGDKSKKYQLLSEQLVGTWLWVCKVSRDSSGLLHGGKRCTVIAAQVLI